ncbi:MAG: hypothetical protein RLZZ387_265, partial [Chloroflexota bacterium]
MRVALPLLRLRLSRARLRPRSFAVVGLLAALLAAGLSGVLYAASYSTLLVTAASSTVSESAGTISVDIELSEPVTEGLVTVNVVTRNGPTGPNGATAGSDYTAHNSTLQFWPGDVKKTIAITVNADSLDEANEAFRVEATVGSKPVGVTVDSSLASAVIIITDDDSQDFVSFTGPTSVNESAATAGFTITLSGITSQAVRVDYSVTAGSTSPGATPGTDTGATPGEWLIPAGVSSASLSLAITNDPLHEATEYVTVEITGITGVGNAGAAVGQKVQNIAIVDNDPAPTISVNSPSVTEGDTGTTSLDFTVSLSNSSGSTVTVDYAISDGSATRPADYTLPAGSSLTFSPGETSKTVSVPVVGETSDEDAETLTLTLSNPSGATIATGTGTGTINDNDDGPEMTASDPSVTEGDSGTATLSFDVSLATAAGRTVTVNYTTGGGTATAGADYVTKSGSLTFNVGETSKTVDVTVNADTLDEDDETFDLTLSSAVGAKLTDPTGTGTITDDDDAPAISVNDPSVTEGNSGTATVTFNLTLSAASGRSISVSAATQDGSATAPADYTALSATTVTFTAGQTSKTVSVTVKGDTLDEADSDTFDLVLSSASNATIADATGVGTITDDDTPPTISVADATVAEGNSGTAAMNVTVTLSAASGRSVSVSYATQDGTAVAPADYTAIGATTLTFAAGETSKTVPVTVQGDTAYEGDQTLDLVLSSPSNATIVDATGVGTIDDDDKPTVTFSAISSSPSENAGTLNVQISLDVPVVTGDAIDVAYTVNTGSSTASGADFTVAPVGLVRFNAGEQTQNIVVTLTNDALDENNETIVLDLTNTGSEATVGSQGSHTVTIGDDDAEPTVRFVAATPPAASNVAEGAGTATITVELSAASGRNVTVSYATQDGTAAAPADYTAIGATTLTFTPGQTSKTISVALVDDSVSETSETVLVNLSGESNATLDSARATHTLTIVDNDGPPQVLFNAPTASASESAGTVNVEVRLTGAAGQPVSVSYAAHVSSTAATPADYTLGGSGTLTFAAGETSKTIPVTIAGNSTYQLDRVLVLELSNISTTVPGVVLGANTRHTLTIEDDDGPTITFLPNTGTVAEDVAGGTHSITAVLSTPAIAGDTITLNLVRSGDAQAPANYTAPASISFAAGQDTTTFSVGIVDNQVDAPDKTAILTMAVPSGGNVTLGTNHVYTLTITDDDESPVATGDSRAIDEDSALTLDAPGITANDSDGDGDTLAVVKLSSPAHGTLTLNPDGSLTYQPAANYHGVDSFTYKLRDPGGNESAAATVLITINPVNDPPTTAAE